MNVRIKESNIVIVLLGLLVIMFSIAFFFQAALDGTAVASTKILLIGILGAVFLTGLIVFVFIRRLFVLVRQEIIMDKQKELIAHLRDLIRVIRTQRHDFINHLQTIYALIKTGQNQKCQQYIENLYQDIKLTSEMLSTNVPELSALLLVKIGVATARNISFEVNIDCGLRLPSVNPTEINAVVGNLIDNAFEAVEKIPVPKVRFSLFETPSRYVLQVWNEGYIDKQILDSIFIPGFTTKNPAGSRGFGLASAKAVTEKNGWNLIVSTNREAGTRFTAVIPKEQRGLVS